MLQKVKATLTGFWCHNMIPLRADVDNAADHNLNWPHKVVLALKMQHICSTYCKMMLTATNTASATMYWHLWVILRILNNFARDVISTFYCLDNLDVIPDTLISIQLILALMTTVVHYKKAIITRLLPNRLKMIVNQIKASKDFSQIKEPFSDTICQKSNHFSIAKKLLKTESKCWVCGKGRD